MSGTETALEIKLLGKYLTSLNSLKQKPTQQRGKIKMVYTGEKRDVLNINIHETNFKHIKELDGSA